ncbi:MAG: hypothetical protein ABW184_12125 [Sphingobium sp.]
MSDNSPLPDSEKPDKPGAKAEARAVEAAAIRRRWITLGEVLAVIAVLISGLTLWNSWSERSDSEVAKTTEAKRASTRAATLILTTAEADKRKLALKPAADSQSVQSQTIMFPTALGAAPAETTGEPRIEAEWFEAALKKARDKANMPDDSRGDERLPVVIATRFLVDGEAHEDVALYDIGYTISGRMFSGHSVTLRGLSLVSRLKSAGAQTKLDARWVRLFPQK